MDSTRPALRLFVLHHAGGSHLPYRGWPQELPAAWDVRLLDAPGHGLLLDQPQIPEAGRLADHLLRTIEPDLTCPYAFFGHSMGALVAYEITRRIVDRGLPLPVWLGVSARTPPQPAGPASPYHSLPEAQLRTRLKLLGGTPDEVFDDPDLWAVFEPVIRADLGLVENWRPDPDAGPLPVPLSAFAGAGDHAATPARLAGWAEQTEHFLGLRVFAGGHFYFVEDTPPVLRQIEQDVAAALDALAATRSS
ncbi:alpha/beta fold hydrolase [Streptomyces bambusae]|uniref:thioesterase II family protein n=1 Tax=Streptomyces bambusae TaxID=1550616 RepID=UPI001CFE6FEB|nr:thioesterase domain-containing protein [Streptomyces bambusae]MCB5168276.1 alpha/beta fold hydrolase [Streptomyces bambusae]